MEARIARIRGSVAEVEPLPGAGLYELVRVGERRLLGEVLRVEGDRATVQVYEETTGLRLGEPVTALGDSLSVDLGPGLLGSVLDGVGRPLTALAERSGPFLAPGGDVEASDRHWPVEPRVEPGKPVGPGDVVAEVAETAGIRHRILTPPGVTGVVASVAAGEVVSGGPVAVLEDGTEIPLHQRWPVRRPRPVAERLAPDRPLITGQRVFDLLYPVAEGGTVVVPGGFGTGKTIIEQSLAKHAAADVVVFVGCGERGNEMAELLDELPGLEDPRTGRRLMERTVLVVNTSNMPVVAREGSIYLAMTVAEHYRDLGYRVALMIDSLSRWAEALRELGSHLREMPGEEGYPTSLASRLGGFFERAGRVRCLGAPRRTGSLTLVAAVSPPGGDLSEPVTQASLRVAGGLWALDTGLAQSRQFPAVSWETSYSLYAEAMARWLAREKHPEWLELRRFVLDVLEREGEMREIAGLVGADALQERDRLTLELGRMVREHVLGQNAFDPADAVSPPAKTARLAALVRRAGQVAEAVLEAGEPLEALDFQTLHRDLGRVRSAAGEDGEEIAARIERRLDRMGGGSS